MKRGDRVIVSAGACDGMEGVVVRPNGAATPVRFARSVQRRNGMWSEEVWLWTYQLRLVPALATEEATAARS